MKLLVLSLLCLLGLGATFDFGQQYTYDYFSQISLGIPEIRDQFAAGGLKAKLIIQMVSRSQAVVKLEDVEVGEFHGYSEKGMNIPLPIAFQPVSGIAKMLEEPFEVNIEFNRVGDMMKVSKGEPEYIINIKKSIAHLFIVRPITEKILNRGDTIADFLMSGRNAPYLNVEGETFFGRCELDYTFYLERTIPNRNIPPMPEQIWGVRKTINFERCRNKVVVQNNGISNSTHAGSGGIGTVQVRSSVFNYKLNTTGGNDFVIMKGHSEGTVILNPFGYKTEKLMSLSNQTMVLEKVENIPNRFSIRDAGRIVKSWQMEVSSPFKMGPDSPPWVNFKRKNERFPPFIPESSSTGLKITSEDIEQFEKEVDEAINNASSAMHNYPHSTHEAFDNLSPFDTQESTAAFQLDTASMLVKALPLTTLEKLFDKYKSQTSEVGRIAFKLYVDVLASSGGGAAWELLLERMQHGEIPTYRAMSIFMTMTNNIASPEAIPSIAKFIKTLSIDEKEARKFLFTTTAWINFASTIHRVCLDKNSYAYSVPYQVLGSVNCSPAKGVSILLPFLKEQLQKSTTTAQKIVVTQAISNMGTKRSLTTLKQIIYGQFGRSSLLRSVAVYGLLRHKMTDVSKHQVQQVLQPILDDTEEEVGVRQVALIVALSWMPTDSWWNEMATLSWQDPSQTMGSFIYSTMLSYSRTTDPRLIAQSRAAEYALRFAKPYPPFGLNVVRATYLPRDHMRTFFQNTVITYPHLPIPREFITYLSNSFGGFEFTLFEVASSSEGLYPLLTKILEFLENLYPDHSPRHPRDVSRPQSEEILNRIKEELRLKKMATGEVIATAYTRFFENIQKFIVLDKQLSASLLNEGKEFLRQMEEKQRFVMTKYFNPVTAEILIPTQIGLPILTRLSSPTIISNEGEGSLKRENSESSSVKIDLKSNFKYVNKVVTSLRVLLPWTNKLVSTGVQSLHNINVPFKLGVKVEQVNAGKFERKINSTLHMETVYTKEFPVVHFHNIPFTLVKQMWPECDPSKINLKPVTATGQGVVTKVSIPISKAYTGIDGRLIYGGDAPYPLTSGNLLDLARDPSKSLKLLASPTSKAFQLVLGVNMGNSATSGLNGSLSHEMFTTEDAITHKTQGTLLLTGKEQRYYQMNMLQLSHLLPHYNKKIDCSIYRSPLPNSEYTTSAQYCLSSNVVHRYDTMDDLKKALMSRVVEKSLNGNLSGGQKCENSKIASFEGKAIVSSRRMQKLKKELSEPIVMNKELYLPNEVDLFYDEVTFNVSYVENLPQVVVNTSYHIYDLIRGLAFPHIYFNYMNVKNAKQEIRLTGNKPMGQHNWYMFVRLPTEDVILDKVFVPRNLQYTLLSRTMPPHGPIPISYMDKSCRITPKKVKTFDGLIYDHSASQCSVVSVINLKRPASEPIILTRKDKSDNTEARIYLPKAVIDIANNQLKVDGRVVHLDHKPYVIRPDGMLVATVMRITPSELVVEVPFKLIVTVQKDYVEITPIIQEGSSLGGICGAYSRNLKYQLIGPRLSYYNDTKLFEKAWMLEEGEGCPKEKVAKERRIVEEYQARYKQYNSTYQLMKEQVPDDGLEYIHALKRAEGYLCVSQLPVGMCAPGRSAKFMKTYSEMYDCYKQESVPESIKRSERRGYMKDRENKPADKTMSIETKHDMICSQ